MLGRSGSVRYRDRVFSQEPKEQWEEFIRFFHVAEVRRVLEDFESRISDTSVHGFRTFRNDLVIAATHDQGGNVDFAQLVAPVP